MDVEEYIRYYSHKWLHITLGDVTLINHENLQHLATTTLQNNGLDLTKIKVL